MPKHRAATIIAAMVQPYGAGHQVVACGLTLWADETATYRKARAIAGKVYRDPAYRQRLVDAAMGHVVPVRSAVFA